MIRVHGRADALQSLDLVIARPVGGHDVEMDAAAGS
jgi:hypothetical protein